MLVSDTEQHNIEVFVLRDFLRILAEVGYRLLRGLRQDEAAPITAKEEESLRNNSLGYGNVGSVMTTMSGAPSHALTALWCPGVYDGQPWIPLFLRRGYRKYLVLG